MPCSIARHAAAPLSASSLLSDRQSYRVRASLRHFLRVELAATLVRECLHPLRRLRELFDHVLPFVKVSFHIEQRQFDCGLAVLPRPSVIPSVFKDIDGAHHPWIRYRPRSYPEIA